MKSTQILCAVLLFFYWGTPLCVLAQHTRSLAVDSLNREDIANQYKNSLIIVPYHASLHHSQLDQEIAKKNPPIPISVLRLQIMETLLLEVKAFTKLQKETHRILAISPNQEKTKPLADQIFSLKREEYLPYQTSPASQDSSKLSKIKQRYLTNDKQSNQQIKEKSYLKDGQLQSKKEIGQYYMGAVILQKDSLKQLFDGTVDGYLFLNQFDLLYLPPSSSPSNPYLAQVHYSFFDKELQLIRYGVVRQEFTEEVLLFDTFSKHLLSSLAKDLVAKIFLY